MRSLRDSVSIVSLDDAKLIEILRRSRDIAVLGLRDDPTQAGHYVPAYLAKQGYRIYGVNPSLAGQLRFGQPVVASLAELPAAVDMVDVFRNSAALAGHLQEFLAMRPAPKVVWFQLGVDDARVASRLEEAGIEVVRSRCTMADHRRFGIGPVDGPGMD